MIQRSAWCEGPNGDLAVSTVPSKEIGTQKSDARSIRSRQRNDGFYRARPTPNEVKE